MRRIALIFLLILPFLSDAQDFRVIDWKTNVLNVKTLAPDTFMFDAEPVDYNDIGAMNREIGNYFIDFAARCFEIIDSSATTITVVDLEHKNLAPQSNQIGRVYESIVSRDTSFHSIGGVDVSVIDDLSRWKDVARNNELFGRAMKNSTAMLLERIASLDSLGLNVSDLVSGTQIVNAGETQIWFPSAFDSTNVVVVPFVRRISDDAVVDFTINDIDSSGFDVVVWDNNCKLQYIASQKITHSSDIFKEPIYSADSAWIKSALRDLIGDSSSYVDGNGTNGYLPKFTGGKTIGNSIISETASKINVAGSINTNADDITVTNKNKYRPLLEYDNTVLLHYQDYVWNGSTYVANYGYGFGQYALQSNSGSSSNGFGSYALQNSSGAYSNGFGYYALQNSSGANSNGFGHYALRYSSGANSNGFGYSALEKSSGANSNGFGISALQSSSGAQSNGFGSYALQYSSGTNSNGFGYFALRYNNWANVLALGHQSTAYFLENPATDKTFTKESVNGVAHTITFASAHGFGATNAKVNLKYTLIAGTSPTGLVSNSVYQFTITSPTVLTYTSIAGTGSSDFEGKLTNSVNISNSIAIGNDVNASKANQVVLGKSSIVETQLFGKIGINTASPDATIEVNSSTGGNLRLTYNDGDGSAINYVNYSVDASGDGTINSSGGTLNISNALDVSGDIYKGSENSKVPGVIFTQTADQTISNTTTETTLFSSGVGSLTLPANVLIAGKTIRIKLHGFISANNGVNSTVKVKIGSVELVSSTGSTPMSFSNTEVELTFTFTCRTSGATGTVMGQGGSIFFDGIGITTSHVRPLLMTTAATVNTTISNTIDLTYTWGTADAGNTITCTNATLEILN